MRAIYNINDPELTEGAVRTLNNLSMHKQGLLAVTSFLPFLRSVRAHATRAPPLGILPPAPPIFHLHPDLNQPHNYEDDGRSVLPLILINGLDLWKTRQTPVPAHQVGAVLHHYCTLYSLLLHQKGSKMSVLLDNGPHPAQQRQVPGRCDELPANSADPNL